MALKKRNQPSAEFSTASIADIVFLLLIYFLLTSRFVTDVTLDVQLPNSSSSNVSSEGNFVSVTVDGTYAWNTVQLSSRDDLEEYIVDAFESDPENKTVTLRIDKSAFVDDAVYVMDKVAKHQGKIVILTQKE